MPHPHPKQHPSRRSGHPISCILQHPRRETTRRVHRPHASSTPTAHHQYRWQLLPFPHITIALAAGPPGSSERTHRVYVSASRMHQHRRMWVAARRTRCRSRGVRAEREGGVRELAVQRVAGRHSGDTDTLRVHMEAYVLPPRRTELSRSPIWQARAYPSC